MNGDPENFESLRRLLAWKRHEQPPPGYFNDFSRRVIARIEAGERGTESVGLGAWLHRFWTALQARPAFGAAFGAAVCAFLVIGLLNSEEAPVVTYGSAPMPAQAVLAPSVHPGPVAATLIASTNSDVWLRDLFNQSVLPAQPAGADLSLLDVR